MTLQRRRRGGRAAVAAALLSALVVAGAPPAQAGHDAPPVRTFTYDVQQRGTVTTDLESFARHAALTFQDVRGWSLGGSVRYVRVPIGGDFTLWLAEASTLPSFGSPCHPSWSCRSGRNVIVNETRWRTASAAWNRTVDEYQHYVVNHELGHWHGLGHPTCPGRGQQAPVMQQQSKGLQGCLTNVWPLARERDAVARRYGVPVRPDVFSDIADSLHADAIRLLAHDGTVGGFPDGAYRPLASVTRGQMASFLARQQQLEPTGRTDFPDIADSVHAPGIRAIADAGIATGYADATYGPRDSVLRGQMAAFLARALSLPTADPECAPADSSDSVHAGAICAVLTAGVAQGVPGGGFAPAAVVTRGQMASFLDRARAPVPMPAVSPDAGG